MRNNQTYERWCGVTTLDRQRYGTISYDYDVVHKSGLLNLIATDCIMYGSYTTKRWIQ